MTYDNNCYGKITMSQPVTAHDYDEAVLRKMYRRMRLIREVELALLDLVETGEIPGDAHMCNGQEASAVGTCFALEDDDLITGTHRSHGHVLAMGTDVDELLAEFGGKATGVCGGRGGEFHLYDPENGVFETSAVVGASVPHCAGAMLSSQVDGDDRVGVAFFGDGASNQGVVFETLNMASIWDLPIVFLCENNQYAVSTASDYSIPTEEISDRAAAFDIPGKTIDGQDVLTVHEEVSETVEAARNGEGPQFVECETYRYFGHFSAEDELLGDRPYRTEEEIQEWRGNRDPLMLLKERVVDADVMTEAEFDEIDDEVDQRVDEAVEFMRDSEEPPGERALETIYAEDNLQPAAKYR